MKTIGLKFSAVLLSIATAALAGSTAASSAQISFDKLKVLAGEWEGVVTTVPPEPSVQGKTAQVTLRVTSLGNAFMHEMKIPGRPDDPITMLYLDAGRLLLTHYCDAGNRPRMAGVQSPDGQSIDFDLLDVAGDTTYGHMQKAAFHFIDADHHSEEWTFHVEGKGHVLAHFELSRKK